MAHVSAHVVVILETAILDSFHLLSCCGCFCSVLIDPVRVSPCISLDAMESYCSTRNVGKLFLKSTREAIRLSGDENNGIVKPLIEVTLKILNGASSSVDFIVPREHYNHSILSLLWTDVCGGFLAAHREDRIFRYRGTRDMEIACMKKYIKYCTSQHDQKWISQALYAACHGME